MLYIIYNNKKYCIQKHKLMLVIEKLNGEKINEDEIEKYLKKFNLYDDYFLKNVNNL